MIRKVQFDANDVKKNKLMAALGYIPVLFFLPLVTCPDSRAGKHCANQGLNILIGYVALAILKAILGWIPILGWLVNLVCWLGMAALLVAAAYGFYELYQKSEAVEYPYTIRILK